MFIPSYTYKASSLSKQSRDIRGKIHNKTKSNVLINNSDGQVTEKLIQNRSPHKLMYM